jgi:pimeloyl-ACP methyl ester carboxylesterase
MPIAPANGIDICYESFGDPADPTVILINGLGGQLLAWDQGFCELLVQQGHHVVRFDNRDVGQSTWFDDTPFDFAKGFAAFRQNEPVPAPYTLWDMAADIGGLLDHLDVQRAHMVGVSMGGMIAQTVAIAHPNRVASVCSIMSTTGDRDVGHSTKEANAVLLTSPPKAREDAVAQAIAANRVIGSPDHFDAERVARLAGAAYDRAFHPVAAARQLLAVWNSGSRTEQLSHLDVPTLVIHGDQDPLIEPDAGRRTAEVIPGAELLVVEGMGHDVPPGLWPVLVDAISRLVARAEKA